MGLLETKEGLVSAGGCAMVGMAIPHGVIACDIIHGMTPAPFDIAVGMTPVPMAPPSADGSPPCIGRKGIGAWGAAATPEDEEVGAWCPVID